MGTFQMTTGETHQALLKFAPIRKTVGKVAAMMSEKRDFR